MTPYEIMLSESQERMLLVVKKGREAEVERIFEKWDLHAAHIGDVTDDGLLRVKDHGTVVAEIPNSALADEAPVYNRPTARPAYLDEVQRLDLASLGTAPRAARRVPRAARLARRSRASAGSTASTTTWCAPTRSSSPGMGAGVVRVKGTGARARDVGRRQRPLLLPRSAPRRDARGRRGGAQRRLRRRDADRRDQLPELRQPRAARRSCGSSSRPSRASPRPAARSTSRSPAATSASTTRPTARAIYPTPIDRRRRR